MGLVETFNLGLFDHHIIPAARGGHVFQSATWQCPGIEAGEPLCLGVTIGEQRHGVAGLQ